MVPTLAISLDFSSFISYSVWFLFRRDSMKNRLESDALRNRENCNPVCVCVFAKYEFRVTIGTFKLLEHATHPTEI